MVPLGLAPLAASAADAQQRLALAAQHARKRLGHSRVNWKRVGRLGQPGAA